MRTYNDYRDKLAVTARTERMSRRYSFPRLSELSGVSEAMLKKIEYKTINPSLRIISQIAAVYGMDVRDML